MRKILNIELPAAGQVGHLRVLLWTSTDLTIERENLLGCWTVAQGNPAFPMGRAKYGL